jgi:hypothetical protein
MDQMLDCLLATQETMRVTMQATKVLAKKM